MAVSDCPQSSLDVPGRPRTFPAISKRPWVFWGLSPCPLGSPCVSPLCVPPTLQAAEGPLSRTPGSEEEEEEERRRRERMAAARRLALRLAGLLGAGTSVAIVYIFGESPPCPRVCVCVPTPACPRCHCGATPSPLLSPSRRQQRGGRARCQGEGRSAAGPPPFFRQEGCADVPSLPLGDIWGHHRGLASPLLPHIHPLSLAFSPILWSLCRVKRRGPVSPRGVVCPQKEWHVPEGADSPCHAPGRRFSHPTPGFFLFENSGGVEGGFDVRRGLPREGEVRIAQFPATGQGGGTRGTSNGVTMRGER